MALYYLVGFVDLIHWIDDLVGFLDVIHWIAFWELSLTVYWLCAVAHSFRSGYYFGFPLFLVMVWYS